MTFGQLDSAYMKLFQNNKYFYIFYSNYYLIKKKYFIQILLIKAWYCEKLDRKVP